MKIKHIILGILSLAFLSSCSLSADDIQLNEVSKVDVIGSTLSQSRVHINANVTNDSKVKITLREAFLTVHTTAGKDIMEISVEEQKVLPKRKTTDLSLPILIRYKGGLGAISSVARLSKDTSDIRVSGTARLKGGCIKKKFELKDVPLDQFLEKIGVSPDDFKKIF